jgi:hypothetical protein
MSRRAVIKKTPVLVKKSSKTSPRLSSRNPDRKTVKAFASALLASTQIIPLSRL